MTASAAALSSGDIAASAAALSSADMAASAAALSSGDIAASAADLSSVGWDVVLSCEGLATDSKSTLRPEPTALEGCEIGLILAELEESGEEMLGLTPAEAGLGLGLVRSTEEFWGASTTEGMLGLMSKVGWFDCPRMPDVVCNAGKTVLMADGRFTPDSS